MSVWWKRAALAALAVGVAVVALRYHRPILDFVGDQERLRAWLMGLGPLGPIGLIVLNAIQVVVAPIPGYVLQGAAGYLFGWLPGTVYAIVGMTLGGILAMSLARIFGRPLVLRVAGEQRLQRWEQVSHLNTLPIWFVLMLGPFGDIPYFIAGLTSLAIWKIILVAVLVRWPSVILSTAVGSGVISWRSPWVIGGAAVLLTAALLGMRYQDRIDRWVDQVLLGRVLSRYGARRVPHSPEDAEVDGASTAQAELRPAEPSLADGTS